MLVSNHPIGRGLWGELLVLSKFYLALICTMKSFKEELSGTVLNYRSRGCGFEPHWGHCTVSILSSTKAYVMGIQKKCLNGDGFLELPKHMTV